MVVVLASSKNTHTKIIHLVQKYIHTSFFFVVDAIGLCGFHSMKQSSKNLKEVCVSNTHTKFDVAEFNAHKKSITSYY